MTTPAVSVIVPTRDRPALLAEALASIAGQDFPLSEVEVVVINDAGADVGAQVRAAREHGLDLRATTLSHNRGLSTARNVGIDQARGEYLAFLDDDDLFLPGHLRTAVAALEDGVDVAYTTCLEVHQRVHPTTATWAASYAFDYPFDPELLSVANYIPVHSVVYRRSHAQDARFDPELTALEDWDLWLRLLRHHRLSFRHVDEPTVVYHRIPIQTSMTGAAAGDAAAAGRFGELRRRVWRHWPTEGTRASRFRLYLAVMCWLALGRLVTGRAVSYTYYEQCLRLVSAAWQRQDQEDGLMDRIAEAVAGDADVANAA